MEKASDIGRCGSEPLLGISGGHLLDRVREDPGCDLDAELLREFVRDRGRDQGWLRESSDPPNRVAADRDGRF
jgi:hypothetical protein